MIEATSCGGVVIYRGKILALYKSYKNRYEGWVLPKGTVEEGEEYEETALREVKEEADVRASVVKYIGRSHYNFSVPEDVVAKEVHWYLMTAENYHSNLLIPAIISSMRSIISCGLPTRSRSWRGLTASTWSCGKPACGVVRDIIDEKGASRPFCGSEV